MARARVLAGLTVSLDGFFQDADAGALYPDPDTYADTHELQVPIFVVTHRPPARLPKRNDRLWFHRRDRWRRVAIAQAAVAADDRAVTVIGGANLIRSLSEARLVDELRIDVMPVMLGRGRRPLTGSIRSWSRSRGSASRRSASGRP